MPRGQRTTAPRAHANGTGRSDGKPAITFWHGSADDCLALVERTYIEGGRHARSVRHYYYQLANAGLLKTWPKRS